MSFQPRSLGKLTGMEEVQSRFTPAGVVVELKWRLPLSDE